MIDKIKIFAEIGQNHMGSEKYLMKYLNLLHKKEIDGITIQIPKLKLLSKKNKKLILEDNKVKKFIKIAKKYFNYVGVATSDENKIKFFENLNIDFFKVTSGMIDNYKLINSMLKTKVKKIYLSTGQSNDKKLEKILKQYKKNKIVLIHTCFEDKIEKINFKRIINLKKKFKLPVAYGSHSSYKNTIENSVFFQPSAIFFYVKLNQQMDYPDNKHALKIKHLESVLINIKNNIKITGK